jgi:hypothetical protein
MSERGWLRQVLSEARADVNTWPDWMKYSGCEGEPAHSQDTRLGAAQKVSAAPPQEPKQGNEKES